MLPSIHQKFQNNMFYQIFSIYAVVTSCKKFEKKKRHSSQFQTTSGRKLDFLKKFFSKIILFSFNPVYCLTSHKNQESSMHLLLIVPLIFGPFLVQKCQN